MYAWMSYVIITFKEYPESGGFDADKFRPLQDRPTQTDISMFTKLLGTRQREDA
jgi:hypothetical protein